jgi:hypothetical protein
MPASATGPVRVPSRLAVRADRRPSHVRYLPDRQRDPETERKRFLPESIRKRGPSMPESPVFIHVWEVDPGQEGTSLRLLDNLAAQLARESGFVSARVLDSDDHMSVAILAEMQSAEDRQRVERLPLVRETLDHLQGTVSLVVKLYHEAAVYRA